MTWLLAGSVLIWWKWKRLKKNGRYIAIFLLVLSTYITTTPFWPMRLNSYLEDQYPPLDLARLNPGIRHNILVLGGGMGYDDRLAATSLLEPVMVVRLVEGIRVYRKLNNSVLITSGYSSIGRKPQAAVAAEAAVLLGVDSGRLFTQPEPSNTREEAEAYVNRFGKEAPLVLATSATHMPRAVYLFNQAGVKTIIPAPTFYRVKKQNPTSWKQFLQPGFQYWGDIQACLHEIVGLMVSRMGIN